MERFVCNECGAETPKWEGRCPACGAWNSLKETARIVGKKSVQTALLPNEKTKAITLDQIDDEVLPRIRTGIGEFDVVLGGGIVAGMAALIGGDPGIGKSTLMMQAADRVNGTLYVSGEESLQQIKLRAGRLGVKSDSLHLLCSTDANAITEEILRLKPPLVVIDSIQSIGGALEGSSAGSVSQVREVTGLLVRLAKTTGTAVMLIGHVTKDGSVAGPKIIEHMVDTVLYFEGDMPHRMLRAVKNRFGSTNEIGIFEMRADGLAEVKNPSVLFVEHFQPNPGIAVGCVLEGSRPFLVEAQTLVTPANYGTSQRVSIGYDSKKLSVMLAVLEKFLSISLRQNDIFVNLIGGIRSADTCLDLAVIASVLSSAKEIVLPPKTLFLGEVGLSGEIRPVSQYEKRINEAVKHGYEQIFIAKNARHGIKGARLQRVAHIADLYSLLFS